MVKQGLAIPTAHTSLLIEIRLLRGAHLGIGIPTHLLAILLNQRLQWFGQIDIAAHFVIPQCYSMILTALRPRIVALLI